jgi:hypothetical protein
MSLGMSSRAGYGSILFATAVAFVLLAAAGPAAAVPAYARQTGQPCQMCHVGAFGPQLKPYARDFKLYGYTANNGEDHFPPLALLVTTTFTNTAKDQPGSAPSAALGPAGPNNNVEIDQTALFFAGRIAPNLGAFIQTTYDGIHNVIHWDDTDIRYARPGHLFDQPVVYGLTLNNHPTIQDLWNSTPAWGFPYVASSIAQTPAAATLIDNALAQRVVGLGAYAMWNHWLFAELDAYQPLDRNSLNALGIVPVSGATTYDGVMPYWRLAVQHDFDDHYLELGAYGIVGNAFPGGDESSGATDRHFDTAFDANYQWTGSQDYFVSAHATLINEQMKLGASSQLAGSNPKDHLSTFRADVSVSLKDTIIPSVQYFNSWGSPDAAYWGTDNGSPNSAGVRGEIAFVPFGKLDSPTYFYNCRLALQYTAYSQFNGTSAHASDNNTLFIYFQVAGAAW